MSLHLRALGRPKLTGNEEPLALPPSWALLILSYVASHEEGVTRSELAATFWPEMGEKDARHNLSQFLYRYRATPWAASLDSTKQRIRWSGTSDLADFWRAVADGAWERASQLVGGEFLEGVDAHRAAGASNWLAETRAELGRAYIDATQRHAARLAERGRNREATDSFRAILARDELAEDALQGFLRNAVAARRRSEGLELYEAFRLRLAQEFGAEPLAATTALAEALRNEPDSSEPDAAAATPTETYQVAVDLDLSVHQTPFVGRDIELAELANTLQQPGARLVTITGQGGAGKSRVAKRLALEQADYFPGGVHFVPLAALTSHEYIGAAIAS